MGHDHEQRIFPLEFRFSMREHAVWGDHGIWRRLLRFAMDGITSHVCSFVCFLPAYFDVGEFRLVTCSDSAILTIHQPWSTDFRCAIPNCRFSVVIRVRISCVSKLRKLLTSSRLCTGTRCVRFSVLNVGLREFMCTCVELSSKGPTGFPKVGHLLSVWMLRSSLLQKPTPHFHLNEICCDWSCVFVVHARSCELSVCVPVYSIRVSQFLRACLCVFVDCQSK